MRVEGAVPARGKRGLELVAADGPTTSHRGWGKRVRDVYALAMSFRVDPWHPSHDGAGMLHIQPCKICRVLTPHWGAVLSASPVYHTCVAKLVQCTFNDWELHTSNPPPPLYGANCFHCTGHCLVVLFR